MDPNLLDAREDIQHETGVETLSAAELLEL